MNLNKLFVMTMLAMSINMVYADRIIMKTGKNKVCQINKIDSSKVTGEGKAFPLSDIMEIIFDAVELPSKKSGIILKNGTLLNGIIRKANKKEIMFRSTSFGKLKIAIGDIAAIFNLKPEIALKKIKKIKQSPVIIDNMGTEYRGKILWYDLKSAGLLTKTGLKKIPTEKLAMVVYGKFDDKTRVILRNRDKLLLPQALNGDFLKFSFGDLSITALKIFKPDSQINKKLKIKKL